MFFVKQERHEKFRTDHRNVHNVSLMSKFTLPLFAIGKWTAFGVQVR